MFLTLLKLKYLEFREPGLSRISLQELLILYTDQEKSALLNYFKSVNMKE